MVKVRRIPQDANLPTPPLSVKKRFCPSPKLAIACALGAIASLAIYLLPNRTHTPITSYSPDTPSSLRTNAEYLATFLYPGVQMTKSGTAACLVVDEKEVTPRSLCESEVETVLKEHLPKEAAQLMNEKSRYQRGGILLTSTVGSWVVNMNGKEKANYLTAIDVTERKMLRDPHFFTKPTDHVLAVFNEIYRTIMGYKPGNPLAQYRQDCTFIPYNKTANIRFDETTQRSQFFQAGVSEQEIENAMAPRVWKSVCDMPEHLKAIWRKIGTFTKDPKLIPTQLDSFVTQLKQKIVNQEDPISVSSWAHGELTHIRPWSAGNGRLTRLVMNALLSLRNVTPVIFPNEEVYQQAIIMDNTWKGSFETFLRHIVIPYNDNFRILYAPEQSSV